MPAPSVIRIERERDGEWGDCGIVALAMHLGETYEDVLRAVSLADRKQGKCGLWTKTMIRVAARLGHTLRLRRTFDLDEARGVLRLPEHVAVLWSGLVIDTNGTIWEADAFLSEWHVDVKDCELLVTGD
jgi:hypothetical protein